FRVYRRGVDAIGGADVADVVRSEKQVRDLQRSRRVLVDVREGAVVQLEEVDLERVDRVSGVLPSLFVERDAIGRLLLDLEQVHVDLRLVEPEIRDELQLEELAPL